MTKSNNCQSLREIIDGIGKTLGKETPTIPLPDGIPSLTFSLHGIVSSELWVVGAYTGSGKTFLALQFALKAAQEEKRTLFFSLEMAKEQLAKRIWAALANVDPFKFDFAGLTSEELERVRAAKKEMDSLPLFLVDDTYKISDMSKVATDQAVDLVIVDFIQNILPEKNETEYEKLTNGIISLQKLGKEIDSAVLVCSQLSNMEAKEGTSSSIIGLKGSGALSAAADVIFWLEKDRDSQDDRRKKLFIRKNRRGENGVTRLELTFPNGFFEER